MKSFNIKIVDVTKKINYEKYLYEYLNTVIIKTLSKFLLGNVSS